jgi:hypothetical protein
LCPGKLLLQEINETMSEYQYYEFQALDWPLTQEQISRLRAYSSRAQITPRSFINEYNWGDFKGNPRQWMEEYFDAFLYYANWGSRQFMLRLPAKLLDPQVAASYCADESFSCHQKNDHIVLSFYAELEDYEWEQDMGWLASLVPIRSDLMGGDHRALYLAWLLAVQCGEIPDDDLEPPVPPRLHELNASLDSLVEFLGIDTDLISAAAERSAGWQIQTPSRKNIREWVRALPSADKDAILAKLIDADNPHLAAEVRQRALREMSAGVPSYEPARTAAEIHARAKALAEKRKKKEAERRALEQARREKADAEARKKHLEALVGREKQVWSTVDKLIATKQPKRYEEAVSLVQDLREVAEMLGNGSAFKSRVNALERENSAKSALIERLRKARLLG